MPESFKMDIKHIVYAASILLSVWGGSAIYGQLTTDDAANLAIALGPYLEQQQTKIAKEVVEEEQGKVLIQIADLKGDVAEIKQDVAEVDKDVGKIDAKVTVTQFATRDRVFRGELRDFHRLLEKHVAPLWKASSLTPPPFPELPREPEG